MDRPRFVYVTYIRSSREQVWKALTDGDATRKYWFGHRIESDWTVGGSLKFIDGDTVVHDDRVLESDPPNRLSYSWHPLRANWAHEPESRVTFTLEQSGSQVKLTVIHEDFQPDSQVFPAISTGWPAVLSSLKSLLETGAALEGIRPSRPAAAA